MINVDLAMFPEGFTFGDDAGEIVVDHVLPLFRGTARPALCALGRSDILFVEGWAATLADVPRPADAVVINLNGRPALFAAMGERRPDVAAVHGDSLAPSGFRGMVPVQTVGSGFNSVSVTIVDTRRHRYRTGPEWRFLVVEPNLGSPRSDTIRLETIAEENGVAEPRVGALSVALGTRIIVRGSLSEANAPGTAGFAVIADDARLFEASTFVDRPGAFEANLATEFLGIGKHVLRALTLSPEGTVLAVSVSAIDLDVMGSDV